MPSICQFRKFRLPTFAVPVLILGLALLVARPTAVQAQALAESPWTSTTPGPAAPPQSRKWIRSPLSETTM